ncbi:type II secretion system protein J [Candidatus Omnitrophota bacterium]
MAGNKRLIYHRTGFTLIELLVAIAISVVITAAVFFSLDSALESWGYSRDMLALQKVLSETIDQVVSGSAVRYGLQDSLRIISAGPKRIEFVPPWTDDSHAVSSENFIYTLNRRIKPGAAVPLAEVRLAEGGQSRFLPVKRIELQDSHLSQVQLGHLAPQGSKLRFIYHPDAQRNPDVIKEIWWDREDGQVYARDIEGVENISRNSFGVEISQMALSYLDNTNNVVDDSSSVAENKLNMISGIEIKMQARLGQYTQSLISFVNLRNSPLHSGYLTLSEGTQLPIPDSLNIHTLLISNISGVSSGDQLQLLAVPRSGKSWRINLTFSRIGLSKAKLQTYSVEYPAGNPVYTEYPDTTIDLGLNLLTLGANGFYDYDDDLEIEDFVLLEDEVTLEVTKMDIEGAGLFVRP